MKLRTVLLTAAVAITATQAFAARPVSIKYNEDIVVEGDQIYSHYVVSCSNGESKDISAWDKRKTWCVGKGLKDDCSKKQIKTAKQVCR
ncbi:hypothetical protein NO559_01445 [Dasania sp. GY-MA-18]|uniref:Uncharacterized protein n=1 Tax=Dasania phycosphaerae TaxID=2950436 RepID=A0A9J6RHB7_9GAMM|nr:MULTISPECIES: hypothetical protein [Dasania]MCR8921415.1 hypothetical protein [Dasania sp. GY-MA-18]MCZ0863843.1 hypothetical protein [Dasania phycosphaerae]MCZ0867571.1 hypothetical protein [Dasania phycosphaerae]